MLRRSLFRGTRGNDAGGHAKMKLGYGNYAMQGEDLFAAIPRLREIGMIWNKPDYDAWTVAERCYTVMTEARRAAERSAGS